jgi:hypothetical protein
MSSGIKLAGGIAISAFFVLLWILLGVILPLTTADNIIHNYEWFHDADTQIGAKIRQITAYKELLRGKNIKSIKNIKNIDDQAEMNRLRIDFFGMQQSCRDLVARYNANSAKANRSIFKSGDLPEHILISVCD